MSADNWTICPKCEVARKQTKPLYGRVSEEEYLASINGTIQDEPEVNTLREDYELGIVDGKFYVIYRASCTNCGFHFSYRAQNVSIDKSFPSRKPGRVGSK